MSNAGKYVLSRNKSAGKRCFMEGRRQSFIDLTEKNDFTPGPGSYRAPSDFGHYDSNKDRQQRQTKSMMLTKKDKIARSGKVTYS